MKPGSNVTAARSITFAPAGIEPDLASPTAVILLSATITTALSIGAAPVPSIRRAARNAHTPFPSGGSGLMPKGVEFCGRAATQRQTIKVSTTTNILQLLTVDSSLLN